MSNVLVEKRATYAIVTLNRPEAMNALSRELRKEFVLAFKALQQDETVQAIILTGQGKAFCAGFDLKELGAENTDNAAEEVNNELAWSMAAFDRPIIGAINGHCITGGFEMALACDILIASENARFADTHARVGILPGWGLSQKLPRLIGLSRAKEISFTGAPVFAQQALDWGLVNHVVPADELLPRAIAIAENIAACVRGMVGRYKTLVDEGFSKPLDEALVWEEAQAIESAKQAAAYMIEARRKKIVEKGRSEKE